MKAEDARAIAKMARAPKRSDHWGPYCTVPPGVDRQGCIDYVHVVYPVATGFIREDDGTTRPLTDEELDFLDRTRDGHLRQAFRFT